MKTCIEEGSYIKTLLLKVYKYWEVFAKNEAEGCRKLTYDWQNLNLNWNVFLNFF